MAVFQSGGVPAGGGTSGAKIADDAESRYEQDDPIGTPTTDPITMPTMPAPTPNPTPDPKPELNPGLPTESPGTPSHAGGNVGANLRDNPPRRISLPDFTPGEGINGPENQDKNGNQSGSKTAMDTKRKNQTQPDQAVEMQATPGASSAQLPWWDPFGYFSEEASSTGGSAELPLPAPILAAAGVAAILYVTQ